MKEASGELSMTLITIIAVGVILAIFVAFWPQIQKAINDRWSSWMKTTQIITNIE